jgi:hypothetical protein
VPATANLTIVDVEMVDFENKVRFGMNFINHRGRYGKVVHMNERPLSGFGGSSLNGRNWR